MPKGTIVVVDDEISIVESISWVLEDEGYRVFFAYNGREALALVREHRPDLVITDLMMPIMSGVSMSQTIQADPALRHIPIIAMTAVSHLADRGGVTYAARLPKPFDLDDVVEIVEEVLSQGRPMDPSG